MSTSMPVKPRDLWIVGILSVITLGIYNIYLAYMWSRELNHLLGRERHSPVVVLIISIVSLGIAVAVYECFFAFDHARAAEQRNRELRMPSLPGTVVALEVSAIVLSLTGFGVIIGMPLGVAATVLLQREFNTCAARQPEGPPNG